MPAPFLAIGVAAAAFFAGGPVEGDRAAKVARSATSTTHVARPLPNPPPRLIFWVDCDENVFGLTNEDLNEWKASGVDGFVCMVRHLRGLGGKQDFTGDPDARLRGRQFRLQRTFRDSDIAHRASERGIKLYLGAYFSNYYNRATPLVEWFEPSWSKDVLPKLTDLAGAAKLLGFAGVAFDQELYPQDGGVATATWSWDYPGNIHTEAEVRVKARERGSQVMRAILAGYPKTQIAVYFSVFPGDWSELVQETINASPDSSAERLDVDFWDGMTRVAGYKAIRFFDATFYKTPHLGTWDNALTYAQNRIYATFSREFSNWRYAWSRVHVAPFGWIDDGPQPSPGFDDPLAPDAVAEQLDAFRKWSAGGEFANFSYAPLGEFDYSNYRSAMQEASTAVDEQPEVPTLKVTGASSERGRVTIVGTAHDDLALRAVRWRAGRGRRGVGVLDWEVLAGDYRSSYRWQTHWSITARVPMRAKTKININAVDIQGLSSRTAVLDHRDLTTSD